MHDPNHEPVKDVGRERIAACQKLRRQRLIWAHETDAKAFDAFWKKAQEQRAG